MLLEQFRYSTKIVPRFDDLDAIGHVNEARYITYLEQARVGYAREVLGIGTNPRDMNMIVRKTVIDYLMRLRLKDVVDIHVRCSRIGRKSFDLDYLMVLAADERLVCSATMTMVAYDYEQAKSVHVSDGWQQRMTDYENVKPERD